MRKYDLSVEGKSFSIVVKSFSLEAVELEVNGKPMKVRVDNMESDTPLPTPKRRTPAASASSGASAAPARPVTSGGEGSVTAPIPGLILEVFVKQGEKVTAGQPVLKMEAMKMENVINAPIAGTVETVHVAAGDAVNQGQELVVVA